MTSPPTAAMRAFDQVGVTPGWSWTIASTLLARVRGGDGGEIKEIAPGRCAISAASERRGRTTGGVVVPAMGDDASTAAASNGTKMGQLTVRRRRGDSVADK